MRYVIIGNSYSAVFAIEAIRRYDPEGSLMVISDERRQVYSRAMLHEYLAGMVDERLVYLRDPDYYNRMKVKTRLGERASAVDPERRRVYLEGEYVDYDRLLLAVGGAPFIPPGIKGLDEYDSVYTFAKFADASALLQAAKNAESAVVLGAGLIGLQCAEGLRHLGLKVSVCEMADTVLPMALDRRSSELVKNELDAEGITVYNSDTILSLNGSRGELESVSLRSGMELACQMVVVAVGVRPNIAFLNGMGISADRGILVDRQMETNVPGVYAAGDCCQAQELISRSAMVLPIIPVASKQGTIAGANMAGVERRYEGGMSLNSMQFGSLQSISYGFIKDEEGGEVLVVDDPARRIYKKVIIKDGRLTGVILVRAIDRAGIYRHLMEKRVDVSGFASVLLDDDFCFAHVPREVRKELFTKPQ